MGPSDIPLGNIQALRNVTYTGWMPGSGTRSSMDILWACISTIILCVFTAVHLNIPQPGESILWQSLRRAKWVIIGIFAPEVVLEIAFKQFSDAKRLQSKLQRHVGKLRQYRVSEPLLLEEHAQPEISSIVAMTDLESNPKSASAAAAAADISCIPTEQDITLTYAFYVVMGGCRLKMPGTASSHCLTLPGIERLADRGVFWNVSTQTIEDKSKADILAKLLSTWQVIWLFIQCIARSKSNLPITILEIHTFIQAGCALLMFLLWLKKPLNVRDATVKTWPHDFPTPAQRQIVEEMFLNVPPHDKTPLSVVRKANLEIESKAGMRFWEPAYFNNLIVALLKSEEGADYLEFDAWSLANTCLIFYVPIVYGCLHMTAWNFQFPTDYEKWLWRASCIIMAAAFIVILIALIIQVLLVKVMSLIAAATAYRAVLICILPPIYIIWVCARLFLVVESLISLRSVPIGVYAAIPWASYMPHI